MKAMKKLVPAFCLLLISAVLLGTSTYAWFAMNNQTKVSGMKVKAEAAGGIYIAYYPNPEPSTTDGSWSFHAKTDYKTSVDFQMANAVSITPTSSQNGTKWFTAIAEDADHSGKKSGENYTELTTILGNGAVLNSSHEVTQRYYLTEKFDLKMETDAYWTLAVSSLEAYEGSSATKVIKDLDRSIRIMLVVTTYDATTGDPVAVTDGSNVFVFAPNNAGTTFSCVTSTTGTPVAQTVKNKTDIDAADTSPIVLVTGDSTSRTGLSTKDITVQMYIYYDGEDNNCFSTNAINADELNIEITFKAIEPNG